MIVLFTDFGLSGPYTGQMKAVMRRDAPLVEVIDLFADAPAGDPYRAAYLLAAYAMWFPVGTIFLCVVDPGVGSERAPVVVEADGRWFVGPENGLFELVMRRAAIASTYEILWRPEALSMSFHGRDVFAPVAAMLAQGQTPDHRERAALRHPNWPDDLDEIVYIDHYGNAITGMRATAIPADAALKIPGHTVTAAATFSAVPPGTPFWYENSNGLIEIAVNRGRADTALNLGIGSPITIMVKG